ncbi:hypothetical protein PPYR_07329 [Photinus pyralis]|uniref:Uncharacterized protein n=1 Tax=Photinus pyralis TaxID=7054 RepID=A0A5N4AQ45_PHOPY|nr:hypothetical protein PPYR_07329 [Photinus pyralis]
MDEELFDFILMDQNLLLNKPTRKWVHEFNEDHSQSEYYSTCLPMRGHPDKFKKYPRMTVETFDYILSHIEGDIRKWSNFRTQDLYRASRKTGIGTGRKTNYFDSCQTSSDPSRLPGTTTYSSVGGDTAPSSLFSSDSARPIQTRPDRQV